MDLLDTDTDLAVSFAEWTHGFSHMSDEAKLKAPCPLVLLPPPPEVLPTEMSLMSLNEFLISKLDNRSQPGGKVFKTYYANTYGDELPSHWSHRFLSPLAPRGYRGDHPPCRINFMDHRLNKLGLNLI